jgi:hypothetical protein
MAVGIAREKGIPYERAAAEDVVRATRLEFASRTDQFLERIDGPADAILTAALTSLAVQNISADRITDAMIHSIAGQQHADGRWVGIGIVRPPTADGDLSVTAASIRVLRHYAPPALKSEMDERVSRALAWLLRAESSTTEDAVMQLLGAKWGGADAVTLDRFKRRLLALQREDGGWGRCGVHEGRQVPVEHAGSRRLLVRGQPCPQIPALLRKWIPLRRRSVDLAMGHGLGYHCFEPRRSRESRRQIDTSRPDQRAGGAAAAEPPAVLPARGAGTGAGGAMAPVAAHSAPRVNACIKPG